MQGAFRDAGSPPTGGGARLCRPGSRPLPVDGKATRECRMCVRGGFGTRLYEHSPRCAAGFGFESRLARRASRGRPGQTEKHRGARAGPVRMPPNRVVASVSDVRMTQTPSDRIGPSQPGRAFFGSLPFTQKKGTRPRQRAKPDCATMFPPPPVSLPLRCRSRTAKRPCRNPTKAFTPSSAWQTAPAPAGPSASGRSRSSCACRNAHLPAHACAADRTGSASSRRSCGTPSVPGWAH